MLCNIIDAWPICWARQHCSKYLYANYKSPQSGILSKRNERVPYPHHLEHGVCSYRCLAIAQSTLPASTGLVLD